MYLIKINAAEAIAGVCLSKHCLSLNSFLGNHVHHTHPLRAVMPIDSDIPHLSSLFKLPTLW